MTPEQFTLEDAPVGLLKTVGGLLILKTEYRNENGAIDAYIVDSGEYFWGDQPQTPENQRKQIVFQWSSQNYVVPETGDGVKTFLRAVMSGQSLVGMLEPESKRKIPDAFEDVNLIRQCDHLAALAALRAEVGRLREALVKSRDALVRVTDERSTSYQARNGRWVSIQGDDGERCDIIHSDITTDCYAAVEFASAALKGPEA